MKRIVIVGGGISGLAAAHRLVELNQQRQTKLEITVLEASTRLGGIIQSEYREGFLLEYGPDSFISEKPEALDLAKRLGLESSLIETNPEQRRSFVVRQGQLRRVPEGFHLLAPSRFWPLVTTDIFSWTGKARMAMDLLLPRGATNGSVDESLASFVRRRLGQEALERMAQPMVGGIYTADPEKLSLRATFPRFTEMEREYRSLILALWKQAREARKRRDVRAISRTRAKEDSPGGVSGARYSLFLSFDQGMQVLVDRLISRLQGVRLELETPVAQVRFDRSSRQWTLALESGRAILADAICLALPTRNAAMLLQQEDPKLSAALGSIPYESTATVNLGYQRSDIPHPLDGFGFVVPFLEKRSIIACTFSSIKFAGRAPTGHVLLRAFVGGALQPEIFALPEDEIIARIRADFHDLLGVTEPPVFARVKKWHNSMPQYHLGHLDRVARISTMAAALPSFRLAGNGYNGPGIPDCIRSGETAAQALFLELCPQLAVD